MYGTTDPVFLLAAATYPPRTTTKPHATRNQVSKSWTVARPNFDTVQYRRDKGIPITWPVATLDARHASVMLLLIPPLAALLLLDCFERMLDSSTMR